jgi:SAM-dependent methyltransferase
MSNETEEISQVLSQACCTHTLIRGVFSAPRTTGSSVLRVVVKPVVIRDQWQLQFTSETPTQQIHKNLPPDDALAEMLRLVAMEFRNLHLSLPGNEYTVQHSRKGKCFLKKRNMVAPDASLTAVSGQDHNRTKKHIIPDGVTCPFLIRTGLMSESGRVHASQYRKFRQINRYLEFVQDILHALPTDRELTIVDFGCGKSYLTFATHYLLSEIYHREVRIFGLDRRRDVVEHCNRIATDLHLQGLQFDVGDIRDFPMAEQVETDRVDLVISLHACDTATDDALYRAMEWNSKVVMAVPCCQHELNQSLGRSALAPLTAYGATKERFASLATDTMRAMLMTAMGYQTQVLEFIETEHTPKNLLLRGVRDVSMKPSVIEAAWRQVRELRATLGVEPLALERQLELNNKS